MHETRRGGSWLAIGEQLSDLVGTSMTRSADQLRAVSGSELWREQSDRGQMQFSTPDGLENLRMMSHSTRSMNSLVGNSFREMEHALAPDEHRGIALLEIDPPSIYLSKVSEQVGLDRVSALDQLPHALEQLGVGEPSERSRHDMTSRDRGVRSSCRITHFA
jgi:hypothetical protein